jgi:hypothetical protein
MCGGVSTSIPKWRVGLRHFCAHKRKLKALPKHSTKLVMKKERNMFDTKSEMQNFWYLKHCSLMKQHKSAMVLNLS